MAGRSADGPGFHQRDVPSELSQALSDLASGNDPRSRFAGGSARGGMGAQQAGSQDGGLLATDSSQSPTLDPLEVEAKLIAEISEDAATGMADDPDFSLDPGEPRDLDGSELDAGATFAEPLEPPLEFHEAVTELPEAAQEPRETAAEFHEAAELPEAFEEPQEIAAEFHEAVGELPEEAAEPVVVGPEVARPPAEAAAPAGPLGKTSGPLGSSGPEVAGEPAQAAAPARRPPAQAAAPVGEVAGPPAQAAAPTSEVARSLAQVAAPAGPLGEAVPAGPLGEAGQPVGGSEATGPQLVGLPAKAAAPAAPLGDSAPPGTAEPQGRKPLPGPPEAGLPGTAKPARERSREPCGQRGAVPGAEGGPGGAPALGTVPAAGAGVIEAPALDAGRGAGSPSVRDEVPAKPNEPALPKFDLDRAVRVLKSSAVRKGVELDTEQEPAKLEPGALVRILRQEGKRVLYRRLSGEGPDEGWISAMKTTGNNEPLLQQLNRSVADVVAKELERAERARQEKEEKQRQLAEQEAEQRRQEEEERRQKAELEAEKEAERQRKEEEDRRRWEQQREAMVRRREAQKIERTKQQALSLQASANAERAAQMRVEAPQEDVRENVGRQFETREASPESSEERLRAAEAVLAFEREASERLMRRMQAAQEAETLAIQDKQRTQQEQEEIFRPKETPDSIWVFVSPWVQTGPGRRYRPLLQQVFWRRIFYGTVQAAFVWDDLFFVAKGDGQLAVADWGQPWAGTFEEWGPIFEGDVQAAWVHEDRLYVVKGGLVASTPMCTDWDGTLEEWGDSGIFQGSVQAAFVQGNILHVIKDGKVATEHWKRKNWDGLLQDWGPIFPRTMKTTFVADGNLYVARFKA